MALIWITQAIYVEDYKVKLTFNDGVSATVDLKDHLVGEIFEPLEDVEFFKKFELDSWTLTWPNDSDFSPEYLYELALTEEKKNLNQVDGSSRFS